MAQIVTTSINLDEMKLKRRIRRRLDHIIDETLMLQIHAAFERYCEPYVPFLTGILSQTTRVFPEYVEYIAPYAHYQYVGTHFNHTLIYHPKATAYWDKVMMTEQGDAFLEEVKALIQRRAKQVYGR